MITDDPVAVIGDTLYSRAITLIAATDQILPGKYFPRLDANQIRVATPNGRNAFQPMRIFLHISISSMYVRKTTTVAASTQLQPIEIAPSLCATADHCPRKARTAAQTIAAAKSH